MFMKLTTADRARGIPCPARQKLLEEKALEISAGPSWKPANWQDDYRRSAADAISTFVNARHGQTLRYLGMPFARVRRVFSTERVWFGIEGSHRRLLEEKTFHFYAELMNDLREHRSATAVDHRHALYRNAAEAWLESILRRDITKLDPGLLIAPLYAQFRLARSGRLGVRPIDLLALRQDGRLVVIELKVSEDREHVLQGADYWQRVEAHRRRGTSRVPNFLGKEKLATKRHSFISSRPRSGFIRPSRLLRAPSPATSRSTVLTLMKTGGLVCA